MEVERARLTHKLAKIREGEGSITEAANIIQELQVETYGSMEKREKVELILEQMRLCLAKQDYIRTQIISKKINTKFFDEDATQDLKLKYYRLMMELDQYAGSYLATCKHYRAVLNTSSVQDVLDDRQAAAQAVVLYLVLAPYDNEQVSNTFHRACTIYRNNYPLEVENNRLTTITDWLLCFTHAYTTSFDTDIDHHHLKAVASSTFTVDCLTPLATVVFDFVIDS